MALLLLLLLLPCSSCCVIDFSSLPKFAFWQQAEHGNRNPERTETRRNTKILANKNEHDFQIFHQTIAALLFHFFSSAVDLFTPLFIFSCSSFETLIFFCSLQPLLFSSFHTTPLAEQEVVIIFMLFFGLSVPPTTQHHSSSFLGICCAFFSSHQNGTCSCRGPFLHSTLHTSTAIKELASPLLVGWLVGRERMLFSLF